MTRARMLLVFVAAGVVAIVAGVITAAIIVSRNHDDSSNALLAAAERMATRAAGSRASETATQAERLGTPMPVESLQAVRLMFCEPLRQPGAGMTPAVAIVQAGTRVYYKPGTCEPDIDANGMVATDAGNGQAATDAGGGIVRVKPTYTTVSSLNSAVFENIVWTPAKGDLNGIPTIMTGRYLKQDTSVTFDTLGKPMVLFRMTEEGQQVFGSLSERLIGYPVATFLDGEPLRGEHGQILAPTIQARITDAGMTNGLSRDDAKRLAAIINNGLAQ